MKYRIDEMYINCNGYIKWVCVEVVEGKKAAITEANRRLVRASVVPFNAGGPAIHTNDKPHGGEASFHERCSCPTCKN